MKSSRKTCSGILIEILPSIGNLSSVQNEREEEKRERAREKYVNITKPAELTGTY